MTNNFPASVIRREATIICAACCKLCVSLGYSSALDLQRRFFVFDDSVGRKQQENCTVERYEALKPLSRLFHIGFHLYIPRLPTSPAPD